MKRCSICLASVPEDVCQCPKCSGSTFESNGDSLWLRRTHQFFTISEFYTKAKPPIVQNGELIKVPIEWKLFEARTQQHAPPIYLWDRDGYVVPSKPEAALHLIEDEDLARIISETPAKTMKNIERSLKDDWGIIPEEGTGILDLLRQVPVLYEPVPRLKDPSVLEKMDWRGYVERLVCPKEGKPPALKAVHRAKLLKPLALKYAPHCIEVSTSTFPGSNRL